MKLLFALLLLSSASASTLNVSWSQLVGSPSACYDEFGGPNDVYGECSHGEHFLSSGVFRLPEPSDLYTDYGPGHVSLFCFNCFGGDTQISANLRTGGFQIGTGAFPEYTFLDITFLDPVPDNFQFSNVPAIVTMRTQTYRLRMEGSGLTALISSNGITTTEAPEPGAGMLMLSGALLLGMCKLLHNHAFLNRG